jgi:anti-sigma regulatory factor (Ser/Thr protein kinase)
MDMKKKCYYYLFPLVFFICITGFCQLENRVFRKISNPKLKDFYATGIYKPSGEKGIWFFSNNNGIVFFDGNDIVNFRYSANDSLSLSSNNIIALAEDSRGNLWIGTKQTGLNILERQTGKIEKLPFNVFPITQRRENQIVTMFMDDQDRLFVSVAYKGFLIVNTKTREIKHYDIKIQPTQSDTMIDIYNIATSFAQDKKNKNLYWITTVNGLYVFDRLTENMVFVFRPEENKTLKILYLYYVNDCIIDNNNHIWFLHSASGLYVYDQQSKKTTNYAPYKIINPGKYGFIKTRWANNKNLFVSVFYERKRFLFNIDEKRFNLVNELKGLAPDRLPDRLLDILWDSKSENIWAISGGEIFFSSPAFSLFSNYLLPYNSHYRFSYFSNIKWDAENHEYHALKIGRDSTGIYKFDSNFSFKNKIDVVRDTKGTFTNTLSSYEKDGSGRWWISTYGGVQILLPGRSKSEKINKIFPHLADHFEQGDYYKLMPDKYGNIYSIASNGNIELIDHNTMQVTEIIKIPLYQNTKMSLFNIPSSEDGKYIYLYMGYHHITQVDLINSKLRFIEFFKEGQANEMADFTVAQNGRRIIKTNDGNVFITAAKNDYEYQKISLPVITPGSTILKVIDYQNQYLIVLTTSQFIFFNYETNKYRIFGKDEGYETTSDNNFRKFFIENRRLIDLSDHGISVFPLQEIENYSLASPAVSFTGVSVFNMPIATRFFLESKQTIELNHKQNTITISFSSYEYTFPDRIEYDYRLEGTDRNWVIANNYSRAVTYANLSPGNYTFYLRSRRDGGKWGDAQSLTIRVIPAFWQTACFKIACLFAVVLVFIYLYRRRVGFIKKREREKALHERELFELEAKALRAQMNPHFIFNSMNSIKSLINKNENDKAANYLTTFSKLIRTLFQNSDKREVSLYEELETCKFYTQLERLRFGDKVEFVFNVDEAIDLKDFKVPALILQPFIENAIWHGLIPKETGGIVTISVKKKNGAIQCIIEDNGIGREQSKQFKPQYEATYQSKGIGLTQSRLELDKLLNEREDAIFIIDKEDENGQPEGTKVIISFKENRN